MLRTSHYPTTTSILAALLLFLLLGLTLPTGAASSESGNPPKRPPDRLQGQVPLEDQESGRSLRPYRDNMRLVGQNDVENRGLNGNMHWLDDCAYVSAYFEGDHPLAGMATLDASNPRKPQLVELQPGIPGTRASQVEVNESRRILIDMPFESSTPFGESGGPNLLRIYQVDDDDCTEITHVGTYDFGAWIPHEHRISEDGNTVYAVNNSPTREPPAGGDAIQVIDVSDLEDPTLLTTWDLTHEPGFSEFQSASHDLDVNADGTRAYAKARFIDDQGVRNDGLWILDTTEVTERQPNPTIHLISEYIYRPPELFGNAHTAQLVQIQGRDYVVLMEETFNTRGCPWGWARIVDIEDELHPLQISTMRLEVSMRRHCDETTRDNAMYSSHFIGVDDPEETSLLFMSWYSSGLRVFDVRDPYMPVEVASYIPGANPGTEFRDDSMTRFGNWDVPYVISWVRYRPETGHIWFSDVYNGFMIVEMIRGLDQLDRRSGPPAGAGRKGRRR